MYEDTGLPLWNRLTQVEFTFEGDSANDEVAISPGSGTHKIRRDAWQLNPPPGEFPAHAGFIPPPPRPWTAGRPRARPTADRRRARPTAGRPHARRHGQHALALRAVGFVRRVEHDETVNCPSNTHLRPPGDGWRPEGEPGTQIKVGYEFKSPKARSPSHRRPSSRSVRRRQGDAYAVDLDGHPADADVRRPRRHLVAADDKTSSASYQGARRSPTSVAGARCASTGVGVFTRKAQQPFGQRAAPKPHPRWFRCGSSCGADRAHDRHPLVARSGTPCALITRRSTPVAWRRGQGTPQVAPRAAVRSARPARRRSRRDRPAGSRRRSPTRLYGHVRPESLHVTVCFPRLSRREAIPGSPS